MDNLEGNHVITDLLHNGFKYYADPGVNLIYAAFAGQNENGSGVGQVRAR